MKRVSLVLAVLFLGTVWMFAQTSPSNPPSSTDQSTTNSQSNSQSSTQSTPSTTTDKSSQTSTGTQTSQTTTSDTSGKKEKVEGCLSGSNGNYTLTDKNGTTYQLSGDTSKLADHVGHEVKITGTLSAAASSSNSTGASTTGSATGGSMGSTASQTLNVVSMKHVGSTCSNAGSNSTSTPK